MLTKGDVLQVSKFAGNAHTLKQIDEVIKGDGQSDSLDDELQNEEIAGEGEAKEEY
jgi:hypothetical protein